MPLAPQMYSSRIMSWHTHNILAIQYCTAISTDSKGVHVHMQLLRSVLKTPRTVLACMDMKYIVLCICIDLMHELLFTDIFNIIILVIQG